MRVGSLFTGIGGLDLGLERAGMEVAWQAEIDPGASAILAHHWPGVPNLGDVTTIDWSSVERPDLLCGGYPCQPFSVAGRRAGPDDERHLWPFMLDAVRVLRPSYVLAENVAAHLGLGFDRVLADLRVRCGVVGCFGVLRGCPTPATTPVPLGLPRSRRTRAVRRPRSWR